VSLAQSSSSSDPGSATEGFGQKIPFHDELTNLGMQLRQFRVPVLLACNEALPILGESSTAIEPSDGALDDPRIINTAIASAAAGLESLKCD